jgi:hypothetical protein
MSSRYWRQLDGLSHLAQRVGQQGVPVAIAPVNWQINVMLRELRAQRVDQRAHLRVQRADAAEVIVVLGHFEHALARHVAAAQHVFQKRHHVFAPLGSAEPDDQ